MDIKQKYYIVLVNGPGSSGKSSASLCVAQALGFSFLSTGNVYRSYAWALQKSQVSSFDKETCLSIMKKFRFDYIGKEVYFHGVSISNDIGYEELAFKTATLAQKQWYRDYINETVIIPYINNANIVIEGRGLREVYPNSSVEFYIKSTFLSRAKRRLRQYSERYGINNANLNTIYKQIKDRDDMDMNRTIAPLKCEAGMVVINNTKIKRIDTVKRMLKIIGKRYPELKIDWKVLTKQSKKKVTPILM